MAEDKATTIEDWVLFAAKKYNATSLGEMFDVLIPPLTGEPTETTHRAALKAVVYETALERCADELREQITDKGKDLFKFFCTLRDGNAEQTRIYQRVIDSFFLDGDKAAALKDFFDFAESQSAEKLEEAIKSTYNPTIDVFRPYKGKNTDIDGQLALAFSADMASKDDKQKGLSIMTTYALTFSDLDGVNYPRNLGAYDLHVYSALGSLYRNGQSYFTLNDVGRAMGLQSNPNAAQRNKILASIKKMMTGLVVINNAAEASRYKYPYTGESWHNLLAADVLPDLDIYGHKGSYIHLLRMPVLLEWAIARQQYTTLPIEVYQVPLSLTDRTLAIEHYLIDRIKAHGSSAKATKGKYHILLDTMYKELNIDRGKSNAAIKERSRAIEAAETILKHFVSIGFIESFRLDNDKIVWSEHEPKKA